MDAASVLETKRYLSRIGAWPPIPEDINPDRWLEAFDEKHRDHAVAILDSHIFITRRQTRKLFTSTIHNLSNEVTQSFDSYEEKRSAWIDFLSDIMISAPTGEIPSPADSGHGYHRMARDLLAIPEENLVPPSELNLALSRRTPSAIIFVDDFAGSGNQFVDTWTSTHWGSKTPGEAIMDSEVDCYYAPMVATTKAARRFADETPTVRFRPGHLLPKTYSVVHPQSIVMPDHLRVDALAVVTDASVNAGITENILGFHDLALAIAFEDSPPDASIALLWSQEGSWVPLTPKR